MRAEEEAAVIALLCEECLRKIERKHRDGRTLFDYGQDEYGFCQPCNTRIDVFFAAKAQEEAESSEGTDSRQ